MANFLYHVQDANSGASIQGAAIYDQVSTSCCNCSLGGCSGCDGCTSGNGFSIKGNTDGSGNYSADAVYTCPMAHDVLVTAVGYNPTSISSETGNLTGDAQVGQSGGSAICLVPTSDVPQSNQGAAGTSQYGLGVAGATNPVTSSNLLLYGAVGVAALVVVVILVHILAHRGASE